MVRDDCSVVIERTVSMVPLARTVIILRMWMRRSMSARIVVMVPVLETRAQMRGRARMVVCVRMPIVPWASGLVVTLVLGQPERDQTSMFVRTLMPQQMERRPDE